LRKEYTPEDNKFSPYVSLELSTEIAIQNREEQNIGREHSFPLFVQ
jgi:hypothetical protein